MDRDVFVDTSAFIALRVKDDMNHGRAQAFLYVIRKDKLRLHTTNFVLDEVYTYFCRSHHVAVEMAELIMNNPLIALHRISAEDERDAFRIVKSYSDKDFSYTDATSFAMMARLNIKSAFVFDEHFAQYGKFQTVP